MTWGPRTTTDRGAVAMTAGIVVLMVLGVLLLLSLTSCEMTAEESHAWVAEREKEKEAYEAEYWAKRRAEGTHPDQRTTISHP